MKQSRRSPRARSGAGAASDRGRGVFGTLLYWLPVLVPLGLFAQIALFGLRPALDEREHLARMRAEMEARHANDFEVHDDLGSRYRARLDPIFRERQRRLAQGPWTAR